MTVDKSSTGKRLIDASFNQIYFIHGLCFRTIYRLDQHQLGFLSTCIKYIKKTTFIQLAGDPISYIELLHVKAFKDGKTTIVELYYKHAFTNISIMD